MKGSKNGISNLAPLPSMNYTEFIVNYNGCIMNTNVKRDEALHSQIA